jgi:hypothetical protein
MTKTTLIAAPAASVGGVAMISTLVREVLDGLSSRSLAIVLNSS